MEEILQKFKNRNAFLHISGRARNIGKTNQLFMFLETDGK
jgi:hypothetical protein